MAHILIADAPDGVVNLERILGPGHELVIAHSTTAALVVLKEQTFDLIIVGVHFDESRMFDLISKIRMISANADKPLICFCTRDNEMTRIMHNSLECSSKAFGAWMYLDQHEYNQTQDPDGELRRIIERCLIHGRRERTQLARTGVQLQRQEIQRLRSQLLAEEWSLEVEDRLGGLRRKLADVLLELSQLHVNYIGEQEEIATSRKLRDRVSEQVVTDENGLAREEGTQDLSEAEQSVSEQELFEREEEKAEHGRRRLSEDQPTKSPESEEQ